MQWHIQQPRFRVALIFALLVSCFSSFFVYRSDEDYVELKTIRELLCFNSAYFKAASLGESVETQEKCITLNDTQS